VKAGTRIETNGCPAMGGFGAVNGERAIIVRPRAENLPLPGPGWHIVKFDRDGGELCMHESSFRIIDNR
jgi:hypothetical protein